MASFNGTLVSLLTALGLALVLALTTLLNSPGNLFVARPVAPDTFYAVIPLWAMQVVALVTFGFSLVALGMGARNFWREAGPRDPIGVGGAAHALWDILTLRNLGGGGHGCNDASERFSMKRRWLHHAMFYGFMLCFAATCVGFYDHAVLGRAAPYPFMSAPVLLGTVGGVLLLIGTVGLFAMKLVDDPMPAARRLLGGDVALLLLLALVAASGLALLALRATGAMGVALAVHLGFILALFVALPYSKMVHGVYRSAALLRWGAERKLTPAGGGE